MDIVLDGLSRSGQPSYHLFLIHQIIQYVIEEYLMKDLTSAYASHGPFRMRVSQF